MKTFVALYMGRLEADRTVEPPDQTTMARGMAAWGAWMEANAARIVDAGGPLGATKKIDGSGVGDVRNEVTGYVVITAESHETAARLFLDHPHFSIFPGDRVEIMERLAIPSP